MEGEEVILCFCTWLEPERWSGQRGAETAIAAQMNMKPPFPGVPQLEPRSGVMESVTPRFLSSCAVNISTSTNLGKEGGKSQWSWDWILQILCPGNGAQIFVERCNTEMQ